MKRLRFLYHRLTERLWIKPLIICFFSVVIVFLAKLADRSSMLTEIFPEVTLESIETLLNILSSSMLVIATFAVASMVSAYASASSTATPRSFSLVISDDVSQNALSTFIGAFIFSIVALIVAKNEYYGKAGLLGLFVLTIIVFALVIYTFVRWVDRIARLGRLGATIDKVEAATKSALLNRKNAPRLGGSPVESRRIKDARPIYSDRVGYVQQVNVDTLQEIAQSYETRIVVFALPGAFVTPNSPLAYIEPNPDFEKKIELEQLIKAFVVGDDRKFDEDPRFGLIVLSEIAGRALSPAVNDPGTAIDIIGTFVRLFSIWGEPLTEAQEEKIEFDRVAVPEISIDDMFDDAFTAIARDGAGSIEVIMRLQKAFIALASMDSSEMKSAAERHSRLSLARAEKRMDLSDDLEIVQTLSESLCRSKA